jgi:hypothetical protein
MGALPQALEIIFEGQMKRSNEKKKVFQLTKRKFSLLFFFSLDPSYFQSF